MPLFAIASFLAAIICMSQYAESSKQHHEESAKQTQEAAVAKGDNAKSADYGNESYKPPVWSKYVAWPEGVGAWAVILTLFVIAWQSVETRAAAKATEDSVESVKGQSLLIERQANLMERNLILQYRPKITVRDARSVQYSVELGQSWIFHVRFQLVNTGGSAAYITEDSYVQLVAVIGYDVGKIEMKWGEEYRLPKLTLAAGESIWIDERLPSGTTFSMDWETFNQGIDMRPIHYVLFTGTVYYTDDLEISRSTGVHRNLEPKIGKFVPKKDSEEEYSD